MCLIPMVMSELDRVPPNLIEYAPCTSLSQPSQAGMVQVF